MTKSAGNRCERDHLSIIGCHLEPAFRGMRVEAIDQFMVDVFAARIANGRAANTQRNILNQLGALLAMAERLGWIERAPHVPKPKVVIDPTKLRYLLGGEELQRFLNAAQRRSPKHYGLYALATYTGLRKGELAGLRWHDVDLAARRITVHCSFADPPKNGLGRRVPILNVAVPVLRQLRAQRESDLVFANRRRAMFGKRARIFYEDLHQVLASAGFPPHGRHGHGKSFITFHGLRHTFASLWVSNGGTLEVLREIMGHKTFKMTLRYAHLDQRRLDRNLGRFDSVGQCSSVAIRPTTRISASESASPMSAASAIRELQHHESLVNWEGLDEQREEVQRSGMEQTAMRSVGWANTNSQNAHR